MFGDSVSSIGVNGYVYGSPKVGLAGFNFTILSYIPVFISTSGSVCVSYPVLDMVSIYLPFGLS